MCVFSFETNGFLIANYKIYFDNELRIYFDEILIRTLHINQSFCSIDWVVKFL